MTHTYVYASSRLLRETFGDTTLDFFYSNSGQPYALSHNGTTYYYITNVQGDVMSIVDGTGAVVAEYEYDPYGNILSTTGTFADTLGQINPLRYRGYVYDQETGLYYVSSRYYDPEISRFINADAFELLLEDYEVILQYNLFAYCWNNPVNKYDPDGCWTLALAGYGYLATAGTVGATNIWNPFGWVVLGVVVVAVGVEVYKSVKRASNNEADPYARPGQKKQGRERKNKARQSKDWKPRSNPKPPKKHTPGRDHRKFKRYAYLDDK